MNTSVNNRVFVLGLDGGIFRVINRFIKEGIMPNIGRILENGVSGNVKSTYPPLTPPAWASFMTGMNPGRRGVYDWLEKSQGQFERKPVSAHHLHGKAIWSILGQYGHRGGNQCALISSDIDGKVLKSSLKNDVAEVVIEDTKPSMESFKEHVNRANEEDKAVEDQLRGLGYID